MSNVATKIKDINVYMLKKNKVHIYFSILTIDSQNGLSPIVHRFANSSLTAKTWTPGTIINNSNNNYCP